MFFNSFSDFFAMGGHGFFVWWSYAFFVLFLPGYYLLSKAKTRNVKKKLSDFYRRLEIEKANQEQER